MFNRTKEIAQLTSLMTSVPQLSVITGPVNSGKTRLIKKGLSDLPSIARIPTPTYHLNLRKGAFNSVESLVDLFANSMPS